MPLGLIRSYSHTDKQLVDHNLLQNLIAPQGIEPCTSRIASRVYLSILTCNATITPGAKICSRLHGARNKIPYPSFCPVAAFSADNTFLTPTGPTLLIVRHLAFLIVSTHCEARDPAPGRFPSTHITKCCLSILASGEGFEPCKSYTSCNLLEVNLLCCSPT